MRMLRIAQFSALLLAITFVPQLAKADRVVVFNDLTDTVTATVDGSPVAIACATSDFNVGGVTAPWELCSFTLTAPASGFTTTGTNGPVFIGEGNVGEDTLSDFVQSSGATVTFFSDASGTADATVSCALAGGCTLIENGNAQRAFDITWTDGTGITSVDHIEFKSDVVPEPSSLMLFGSGLLGFAAMARRKLFKI